MYYIIALNPLSTLIGITQSKTIKACFSLVTQLDKNPPSSQSLPLMIKPPTTSTTPQLLAYYVKWGSRWRDRFRFSLPPPGMNSLELGEWERLTHSRHCFLYSCKFISLCTSACLVSVVTLTITLCKYPLSVNNKIIMDNIILYYLEHRNWNNEYGTVEAKIIII